MQDSGIRRQIRHIHSRGCSQGRHCPNHSLHFRRRPRRLETFLSPVAQGQSDGSEVAGWHGCSDDLHLLRAICALGTRVFRDADIQPSDLLRIATMGNAETVGASADLGPLESGKLRMLFCWMPTRWRTSATPDLARCEGRPNCLIQQPCDECFGFRTLERARICPCWTLHSGGPHHFADTRGHDTLARVQNR